MNLVVTLAFAGLGAGLLLALRPLVTPAPHRTAEAQAVAGLPPALRRPLERYIERRAGKGATTAAQFGLVLLTGLILGVAVLFPFFSLGAVFPAVLAAFVAGQMYLQAQELRRTARLDEQALEFLTLAVANLAAAAHSAPARVIGGLLASAEAPLREEIAAILPPLQGGKDFRPALEDVLETTRSARLRRVLHLWRASEEETLGPAGQAARFQALFEQERLLESLRRETLLAVRKAQSSMYVVIGIIPALVAVMMALVPAFREAYMNTLLGHLGLGIILALEFLAVFLSRRIVRAALK